jgi:threonine dehydrogenase-like Zn-dependent dehydrogenase
MKALCWHGTNDIRCDSVPDPKIEDGRDVIIKVTSCATCGSDLHLMDGLMKSGDILGHEIMGEVIETGSAHDKFKTGDRIVVPFNINCGECRQCKVGNYSVCQRSNRNAAMAAAQFGCTTAGLFGYSHVTGGYAGGQAEYVRVPMIGKRPQAKPCEAINGIVAEGEETIEEFGESPAIDTGRVAAGQAVEHYEMARYGALAACAGQLGMPEAAALLNETLKK